ncbi:lysozyme [Methylobacterium sp. Leaf89]|uniref:lysozyme n=1 Tax=Methylobacterium sp. Leaf89 TaxID=1736245 RepID=UPI000701B544|nr:lysozyme [Methylobacterium sp. Leaf89]KQO67238.1 muraminidase [Methylobacterium sp. Leaf89]
MKTNIAGLSLIKSFEGCELAAYKCPAGVLTIGYGHTGTDVKPGQVITAHRAEELLQGDLARFERAVEASLKVSVTPNQFAALVSLAYNIGGAALARSTLIKRLNAGKTQEAADQFLAWNKAGGKVLKGLARRREAERALFLHP